MTAPTLRDAKRAATYAGLALAALRLAEKAGLDGFTIDDIVTDAGYSRRTFANHFASKEDAVVAAAFIGFDDLDRISARLPERVHLSLLVRAVEEWPALVVDETVQAAPAQGELPVGDVVDALERIILSSIIVGTLRASERLAPLVTANPTLMPALLARKNSMSEAINRLIGRIDGLDLSAPYLPILLGAISGSVAFGDEFAPGGLCSVKALPGPVDEQNRYHDHIRLTFTYLRHGFTN